MKFSGQFFHLTSLCTTMWSRRTISESIVMVVRSVNNADICRWGWHTDASIYRHHILHIHMHWNIVPAILSPLLLLALHNIILCQSYHRPWTAEPSQSWTDKSMLKVKMQSVSDDDVRKRLLEKPRFELAVKGVFRLGKCVYLLAGSSRFLGQRPGKHGYRWLITWPVAPEDDWWL